jgi:hypothetical protein
MEGGMRVIKYKSEEIIIKEVGFKEAKEKIMDEALKTKDADLIGAIGMILKVLEKRRNNG